MRGEAKTGASGGPGEAPPLLATSPLKGFALKNPVGRCPLCGQREENVFRVVKRLDKRTGRVI